MNAVERELARIRADLATFTRPSRIQFLVIEEDSPECTRCGEPLARDTRAFWVATDTGWRHTTCDADAIAFAGDADERALELFERCACGCDLGDHLVDAPRACEACGCCATFRSRGAR